MQALPPLSRLGTALFLDFDGTLAELAAQPDAVEIPADLVSLLSRLSAHLGGALALVSGRRLRDLDEFLAPLQLPVAAEHGAVRRLPDGRLLALAPPALENAASTLHALVQQHPRLRLEVKTAAVALHYRQAPELEGLCLQLMTEAARRSPGVELLRGKCVFELKPVGVSKGLAIAAFMAEPPFSDRLPLFAGDDSTDESGFSVVQSMGGNALKIGPGPSLARHRCDTPAQLRAWLAMGLPATLARPAPQGAA